MKEFLEKLTPDEMLQLDNQVCFPLYATAKCMVAAYRPLLDSIDLTYTQYLVMMLLWENPEGLTVREIGDKLFLDSGTLTPLLRKLEGKLYVEKERSYLDERVVIVKAREEGRALKNLAYQVPATMVEGIHNFSVEDAMELVRLLKKLHMSLDYFASKDKNK